MSDEIHVNDIGVQFKAVILDGSTVVDLSTASVLKFIFRKTDDTLLEVNASLFTDGTDGIIKYNTVSGDLDQSGRWKIQAYIEFSSTVKYYSNIDSFMVHCNL